MLPELQLTPEESSLVENASWLLTKHRIIGKVYGMLGMLSETYNAMLPQYSNYIPDNVTSVAPKIYKGEQYRQLPYVMMDLPRYFKGEDTFAIRSFFWWGNSFSIHLVLGGKYKTLYEQIIRKRFTDGSLDQWFAGISADPWQHHFEMDNYRQVSELKGTDIWHDTGNYLKLGKWHPLNEWKTAPTFFSNSFKELLEALV